MLDSVIDQWRASNKDQFYVAFIKFDDFQTSDEKDRLLNNIQNKGIFSSIQSAEQDLRDIEQLSERALFLANRMPILIRWQSELFVYRLASTDEFINLGNNMESFRISIENASDTFSSLPLLLDQQKSEFIHELAAEVHAQRLETLQQVDSILSFQRAALFSDIESHADSLTNIFQELGIVTQSLQQMTASVQSIIEKRQENSSNSSEFSVSDVHQIVHTSNTLTENLKDILEFIVVNDLIHEKEIQKAGTVLDRLITKVFLLTTCFVIITIIFIFGGILFVKRKSKIH